MEQVSILALRTFAAAGADQHRGVQAGGVGPSCALGNNDFDEKDFASRAHGCSGVGQDSYRRFVVPVVDDPLQQVGVRAWHGFSEVAWHLLDSTGGDVPVDAAAGRRPQRRGGRRALPTDPGSGLGRPSAAHHAPRRQRSSGSGRSRELPRLKRLCRCWHWSSRR